MYPGNRSHRERYSIARPVVLVSALVLLFAALPALAHDEGAGMGGEGYYMAVIGDFDRAADKVVSLAEAIPADKYGWGPEGVRTVIQSLMHIAGANYGLGSGLGAAVPEGVNPMTLEETVTTRDEALKVLKASIDHARSAIEGTKGMDLNAEKELFGRKMSTQSIILIINGHMHEHLGQLIAYARMNGVVPPWSAAQSSDG